MENTFENLKRNCEVEELLIENLKRWKVQKVFSPTRQCKNIERHNMHYGVAE